MKKLSVCLVALEIVVLAGTAGAASIGIGAFGGTSTPIVQDDNGSGAIFGIRVPVSVVPLLTVEPYFAKTNGGDKDQDVGGITYTRSGIDVTSYGANAMLTFGTGIQMYPFVGIGSAKTKRVGLDATNTQYNFGLGVGFTPPVLKLSIHLRGEVASVLEPGTSESARKWANLTLGVSYGLIEFPPVP